MPTWNQRDLLVTVLDHLHRQTHACTEVLVVDNGSTDDTAAQAERLGARVIRMGLNAGFSRAVNRGIQSCSTEWIAVVNNDVELQCDWLERLLDAAVDPNTWFVTGKIYRAGSTEMLDGTFDEVSRAGCAWRCGEGRQDGAAWSRPRRIRLAPFTAAVFRRELFDKVGLLDEEFESYLEDVDFGLRCAIAGCEGRYEPSAVAWHRGSATLGRWHPDTVRLIARNQVLLVAKHFPSNWPMQFGWPVLAGQMLWGLVMLRHGAALPYLRGKLEGLRKFPILRRGASQAPQLGAILRESEQQLHRLQRESGFDWYWRLYFALT
ncbi:MAG: glycosyltransferase family 2 protein [bacterium]|nr:glycosyltransferase family 2 protein [bacterium]